MMDLYGVHFPATNDTMPKSMENLYTALSSVQFQDRMDELQMNADILKHLRGIPFEAVYIAPNILEKMKNDPSTYNYYMKKLDGFVGEYKRCHRSGVLELSFSIGEDGQYCTSAKAVFLDALNEGFDDTDTMRKNTQNLLPEPFGIELLGQLNTGILASFAGADFIHKERIQFFDPVE